MALALPRECPPSERRAVLRALGQLENRYRTPEDDEAPTLRLELGESGSLELQRVVWGAPSRTLRPGRWCRASHRWATVTPIALDRNPGDLHDSNPERRRAAFSEAEAIVREAVRRVAPAATAALVELDVVRSCVVSGTTKPRDFPRFPIDRGRPQRVLVHARLVFARPLRGPLLLGAGRYQGLGLCLPVDDRQSEIREEES
jgi:CRISPR-associated protein Csb2